MNKKKIAIAIVSDVVCPWCYIGKRRLERAMEALKDSHSFEIVFHPFELNPTLPEEGVNQKTYLSTKFGGDARYEQITGHVTRVAAEEGLKFDFTIQQVSPNTRKLHRIIQFAAQYGKQPAIKEAFMKAYFEEGVDLSKHENILKITSQHDLPKDAVNALLHSTAGDYILQQRQHEYQQMGITGVPYFIINNKYGVSGAQPTETFVQLFNEIEDDVNTTSEACSVTAPNC